MLQGSEDIHAWQVYPHPICNKGMIYKICYLASLNKKITYFLSSPQHLIGCPFGPVNLGCPAGGSADLCGTRLKEAPVSTR